MDRNLPMIATDRMAFSVAEAARVSDSCRDKLYGDIRDGRLRAKKNGRRTVILRSDLEAYLAALPDFGLGR